MPVENQRKIVADNERVYATLAYGGPMSILDAATGEIISTVEATQGATEILVSDGIAVTYRQAIPQGFARRRGIEEVGAALLAVDGQTGQARWERSTGSIRPLAIAIQNDRVIYVSGNESDRPWTAGWERTVGNSNQRS